MTRFRHASKILSVILVGTAYAWVAPAPPLEADRLSAARGLRFESELLASGDNGHTHQNVRSVNPSLRRINAWVSSVGAAVALGDLDGDGLPNDACLIDPRNDSITIRRVPSNDRAYPPIVLPDITEGYDARTIAPMGCLFDDLTEDGKTDILVYYWGRTPILFAQSFTRRLQPGPFTPIEIVPTRERWFTNACLVADIDGDGHNDLVIGNYFRDGDSVLDPNSRTPTEMGHSMARADNGGSTHLLMHRGHSTTSPLFVDASDILPPEARHGWTLALGARDLDDDLLPELYVANDFGPDHLLHNRSQPGQPAFAIVTGERTFVTTASRVLGHDSFKGMGVDFADINADNRPDIVVSNLSKRYGLLESHFLFINTGNPSQFQRGIAPFVEQSDSYSVAYGGWAWDIKCADLNNDGRPELVQALGFVTGTVNRWPELQELATANDELLKYPSIWPRFSVGDDLSGGEHERLLAIGPAGRYIDVSSEAGIPGGLLARGIAVADVDGDGRLDIAIARQWGTSVFLHNIGAGIGSTELDLRVKAGSGSRTAIGARVTITRPDGHKVTQYVDGGTGHSGKRAPEIHFGLGSMSPETPLATELTWRDSFGIHNKQMRLVPGRYHITLDDLEVVRSADRYGASR